MIGVYVHLPFCLRKCPYCAFYSVSDAKDKYVPYVQRLLKEAATYAPQEVDSIYFGGGTPTALPPQLLSTLLEALLKRFPCKGEITIEANPATISPASLIELQKAGFNRISIGVQSLNPKELMFLGRLHLAEDAIKAIKDSADAGFTNISADVMFGLPGQTPSDVANTVLKLIQLPVSHISAYSLSIEDGTPFAKQNLRLPEEETEREMYYTICRILEDNGFMQYEISNFSRQGMEAVHNTNYWLSGEYIGLGAGAHGFLDGVRYENQQDIDTYLESVDTVYARTQLTDRDRYEERYMLGLRMLSGIVDDGNPHIPKLIAEGLLERNGDKIRLSRRGIDIANYVIAELVT